MEHVSRDTTLGQILDYCREHDATDLHAQTEARYCVRVHGKLFRIPIEIFPPPTEDMMRQLIGEAFTPAACERILSGTEVDLSFYYTDVRYRANFSKQKGRQSFSFRIVPQQRMKLKDLQLPVSLRDILNEPRGLVLVTGPTGQGKSTTLRALIQEINETTALRIVTIEDPIEYVFDECLCQFEQREVGIDTPSFAHGIRNAMRQDPNVIFIGEIRDRESIWAAMQAAETGHLVLTTLHADSVPQAIGRIREFYPVSEQGNISALLARNTNAILCQRLIPNVRGTRTPCLELMRRDAGIQEAITANNLTLISGHIEACVNRGMHTFDQYLIELLAAGVISEEIARHYASNKHRLDLLLRGVVTSQAILIPDKSVG
ncbi:MAG: PilT/PilU family type 4a pilus ATPase [Verrucomicrobia bacterium]|nr:PilT/PilU family type 4a pilus ATPase [Verrucomicrobiota bacterium]